MRACDLRKRRGHNSVCTRLRRCNDERRGRYPVRWADKLREGPEFGNGHGKRPLGGDWEFDMTKRVAAALVFVAYGVVGILAVDGDKAMYVGDGRFRES